MAVVVVPPSLRSHCSPAASPMMLLLHLAPRLPTGRGWMLDEEYIRKIVGELSHNVCNRPIW